MRFTMAVCDMNRTKLCEQYDSALKPEGQAYDVTLTTEISGWKELTFSLPQMVGGARNFRWDFIRSGYMVQVTRDSAVDWFLLQSPKRSHRGMAVTATITCEHVCSLLNKKKLDLTFDDTNGVGTSRYLIEQVQSGTGWQQAFCETFYESDGITEKVRSLSSESKRGAYLLISDICKLFSAYPVFDGDARTVSVYSLKRHEDMLELNFGKNLTGIDRKEDASNVVTRLYVEGEYMDKGYVGIDDVNPTGLPFLLDFEYYRQLGVFKQEHETALTDYIRDIAVAKADSSKAAALLIERDNRLNELWGPIDYVLFQLNAGIITRTVLGGEASHELANIDDTDEITVLRSNGTHEGLTGGVFPVDADYAIKFIQKPYGIIGGKEVAIEAKRESIANLIKRLEKEPNEAKQQALLDQITGLNADIKALYQDNDVSEGLFALMRRAALLALDREELNVHYQASMSGQQAVEQRFALSMGDMLRDGYWANTSYAPGQEELLYLEAVEMMTHQAKPSVAYTVSIQNLSGVSGYERERFTINMALRIWDEALSLNDTAYVTKLVEHPEAPDKDGVTISNNLSAIGGLSLDGVIARITGIAEAVNQKKALYDRSRAISQDGSIPAKRLEGMIDVLRTRLSSSVSNWYTDENGNLVLEAVNGLSAMQLCGDGFMIANRKTDDGKWDWRTFGTGEGFSADMLVTGFLSADRIDAHSITANKLASDVGQSLDLSSNTTINLRVEKPTVGGTNLIPNTSDQYVEVTLGQYYTPVSERIELAALSLSPGDTITCSMYLKTAPEKAACARVTTYYAESGDDGKTIFAAKEPISAESEGKSQVTLTLPPGAMYLHVMIQNSTPSMKDTVSMSVKCVKLERGDTPTDWSPAPDDMINHMEMKLTDAYSQMSATAEGIRQEVRANYAGLADLGAVTRQLSTLQEQAEDHFTWAVTKISELGGDAAVSQALADERFTLLKTYMTFSENGLIIGKSGNPVTLRVINDRVAFYMNNSEVAYLSNNKLYVTQAEVLTRLKIGKFAFEPQTNGNLSLIYTG